MALVVLGVGGVAFGMAAASLGGSSSFIGMFGWVIPVALVVLGAGLVGLLKK